MTGDADARRAAIISYWQTVEMFSPPTVDKVSPARRVFAIEPGQRLPWERGHQLERVRLAKHQAWRHVVYLGTFSLQSTTEALLRIFTPDEESFDERPAGDSALAAFMVSDRGYAIVGSEVLSSCAWATGQAARSGSARDWRQGFSFARTEFSVTFAELIEAPVDGALAAEGQQLPEPENGCRVDLAVLEACLGVATSAAGAGALLSTGEIRVRSEIVSRPNARSADGHDFLNSFIAEDLAGIAQEARSGRAGLALREYLRPTAEIDLTRRADVREKLDVVSLATAPSKVPLGRWPSKPEHPLALSQQLAVNSILAMIERSSGIFGVNGPPGTGKTTMLRDLVAAIVVERALRLAKLDLPADAFVNGQSMRWKTGEFTRVIHVLRPELTGFEMVVASANNGAVENVTKEIPAQGAIDKSWQGRAAGLDYFSGIASGLLDAGNVEDRDGDRQAPYDAAPLTAWALIAARLGNMRNRRAFADAFWYRKPGRPKPDERDADRRTSAATADPDATGQAVVPGMLAVLKRYEAEIPSQPWQAVVAELERALGRVVTIQEERQHAYESLAEVTSARQALWDAGESLASARESVAKLSELISQSAAKIEVVSNATRRRLDQRGEHRRFRPGFVAWLTSFGRETSEWRHEDRRLAGEVAAARGRLDSAEEELLHRQRLGRLAAESEEIARLDRQQHQLRLARLQVTVDQATARLGAQFPDATWWQETDRRELQALWTDPEWERARSDLFLAALALHKAFVQHVPTQMRQSLHAAVDIVAGAAPTGVPASAALAAWQALFLVVPVVSTTFASFARLFSHLGQEALGWLFIDEAGQATPQNAVGALWRSKRAVVVGDPLQLEPITTLPFRAEQAIRRDHDVSEEWSPSRTSVQRLVDRLTPLGTWLPTEDGETWVGAPLRVHRRCDEPMFSIVNHIAYDGLMIFGTASHHRHALQEAHPTLVGSQWFDVAANHSEGHWRPREGEQLDRLIDGLAGIGFDLSQVMVIGPFRDVARKLAERARRWPGIVAGTVHTAQGKQADIVIIVLGSDPQRPGARSWAAKEPNLLNVAVSRAKRRLYVIGDRQAWARQRHFDVLASGLPRSPAP